MMNKVFKLKGLDCANCAAKVERKMEKLKWVEDVNVDFMTTNMYVEAEEYHIEEIEKVVHKVDKNIVIVEV